MVTTTTVTAKADGKQTVQELNLINRQAITSNKTDDLLLQILLLSLDLLYNSKAIEQFKP